MEDALFTLIPYVFKRHRADGRPYGMVRAALDPQRELNKRRSKAMHLLNTAQVIADIDAVDDPNVLAREAARPDGIILKRSGKDLRIIRNSDLASSQVAVMESAARDIQEVIGVYDETLGKQSNATSGVAIQHRLMGQLQGVVALLLDNKPRQAVTVWNSLQLHPALRDARLTTDGLGVWLTPVNGDPVRLELDDVIRDLERLLAGRAALDG